VIETERLVLRRPQPGNERSVRVAEKLGERYERDVLTAGGQTARLYAVER